MVSVLIFVSKFEERSFHYETRTDKSSYKSAENYLGKGESNRNTGEPQVLRQWDDVQHIQIPSQWHKYTFTFDGA